MVHINKLFYISINPLSSCVYLDSINYICIFFFFNGTTLYRTYSIPWSPGNLQPWYWPTCRHLGIFRFQQQKNRRIAAICHKQTGWFMVSLIARFMGPTWGPSWADKTQVGPMLAPWTLLSGIQSVYASWCYSQFVLSDNQLGSLRYSHWIINLFIKCTSPRQNIMQLGLKNLSGLSKLFDNTEMQLDMREEYIREHVHSKLSCDWVLVLV